MKRGREGRGGERRKGREEGERGGRGERGVRVAQEKFELLRLQAKFGLKFLFLSIAMVCTTPPLFSILTTHLHSLFTVATSHTLYDGRGRRRRKRRGRGEEGGSRYMIEVSPSFHDNERVLAFIIQHNTIYYNSFT